MESENVGGVLKLLQRNDNYSLIASELQTALSIAEKSQHQDPHQASHQTTNSNPSPNSPHREPLIICRHFCGLGGSVTIPAKYVSPKVQRRQEELLRGPVHHILPYTIDDDSPLSLAFSNFRDAVKHMLNQDMPLSDILGPLDTEVDLLFRVRSANDPFTAGTWACELARIYEHIDFFTQLANAFLLSRYMRWVLDPSLENYILLPDIMKPTHAQRVIPHFASADLYSIPAIRDSLIRGELKLSQAIGKQPVLGVRIDWPFDLEKAVDRCPTTGTAKLSRLFAACASDAKYWSCSQDFLEKFPEAQGHLNVITHQHDWDQLTVL